MTSSRSVIHTAHALINGQLMQGQSISIEDGKIAAITNSRNPTIKNTPLDYANLSLNRGILVPGFIDTQVNGGGGAMFNHDPSLVTLKCMMKAHSQFGTTAMLPTIITDNIEVMQAAADAVAEALNSQEPGIIGIHFEGPHLSLAKRGCHPPSHLRNISESEWAVYLRKDLGVKVITVAPEAVTCEQIKILVESGAIVSLGHSNAKAESVLAAINAGATGFTHLYNGMSASTSREPGMVGTALTSENCYCGIILDGQHVHPLTATLAWRAKGRQKLMLVSDAMSPVGTELSEFDFFDGKVIRDGLQLRDKNGSLAGSVLDMASAVRYAANTLNLGLENAIEMASKTPAAFINSLTRGDITIGKQADFVWLDDDLQVLAVWVAGQVIYQVEHVLNTHNNEIP